MDERTLMAKIAGGDEAALHALLRQYGPLIRYILRPILTDERDREECYADISLKVWQTAGSFDGEKGTLKAWLTVLSRQRRPEPCPPRPDRRATGGGRSPHRRQRRGGAAAP